jgi:sugar lactone lactonase YvrE
MAIVRIPATALLPVHQANAVTGEAPFWDARDATLWWIDVQGQRLLGFSPENGRQQEWSLPLMPGLVAGRASGGLLLGLEDGFYAFDVVHGTGDRLVAVEADDPRTRINDGKPDPRGRLWFGTMDKTGAGTPIGALYRLELDGRVTRTRSEVRIPNAICFSPDGRTAYFTDTRLGVVEARPYDPATGEAGAARPFVSYGDGEHADGACVDSDGCVWIAVIGGSRIERRRPDGELDTIVELPVSRPTMPMLGGADGRTLFVTSQRRFLSAEQLEAEPLAGDLLAVRVDATAGPAPLAAEPVVS